MIWHEITPNDLYAIKHNQPTKKLVRSRVDLGVMAMKGYYIFCRSPEMEPYRQSSLMSYSGNHIFLEWKAYPWQRIQSAYFKPSTNRAKQYKRNISVALQQVLVNSD